MGKYAAALLVLWCGAATVGQEQVPNRLHFKTYGFSIQPLESPPGKASYQALLMYLPPSGGFNPNVNVVVQQFDGTIDAYAAVSKKQFRDLNFKLIKEAKIGRTGVQFEYSGALQGHAMHWYARAVSEGGKVYLVTATALDRQWPAVGEKLKTCVDSFKIEAAAPGR